MRFWLPLQSTINAACNIFAMYLRILLMAISWHIWQVWNEDQADEEDLAMVVRTGLCTTMGDMLRQVMAPLNETSPFKDPFFTVRVFQIAGRRCCWWPQTITSLLMRFRPTIVLE